jgi:general nucleoside transport system permease protein
MERMSAQVEAPQTEDVIVPEVIEPPVSPRHRLVTGVTLLLTGLVCVLAFGLGARSGDAVFGLSTTGASRSLKLTVPAGGTAVALGVVVLLLAAWQLARGFSRRAFRWVLGVTLLCLVAAFLCWSASGTSIDLLGLLQNTIFLAVPLILGALGGILCERSGVINVAIEGQLLTGAFAAALVATLAHNLGAGVVAAVVAGGLIGALLAVFALKYYVNQVILGVVLNVFALGLTGFVYDAVMQPHQDTYNSPAIFSAVKIPGLGDIPVIGPLLFDTNVLVYATYVLIVVVDVWLFRTRWGLRTRAVGEHPKAADTVGIKVNRMRYVNTVLGGMVAGLGGAYLTIGTVGAFSKNISSGKGFIALAAVIFGRWSPRGALGAALLFGFADALQTILTIVKTPVTIPSNFLAMLPYLATLFAVAGLIGRVRAPAADGEPYVKG